MKNTFRLGLWITTALALCPFTPSMTEEPSHSEFTKALDSVGAVFKNDPKYHSVPLVEQNDVAYQFAFRKENYDAEIRVFLHPVTAGFPDETENKKFFLLSTQAAMLNISQPSDGQLKGNFKMFPPQGVRNEFNAEYGMTGLIPINAPSGFGKGFKFANVVCVWRPKVGFIYTIFLFDDLKKSAPFPPDIFYSTRFKAARPTAPN